MNSETPRTATGNELLLRETSRSRLRYLIDSALRAHGWDGDREVDVLIVHKAVEVVLVHLVNAINSYQSVALQALNSQIPKIIYTPADFIGGEENPLGVKR